MRPGLSATFDDQLSASTTAGSVQYTDELFRQLPRYRKRIVGNPQTGGTDACDAAVEPRSSIETDEPD